MTITKADRETRVVLLPEDECKPLRWAFDLAITALEHSWRTSPSQPREGFTAQQQDHLRRLDQLRMAIHEDY